MLESYLVALAVKSTLLLAAGVLLVRCSPRASATTRHWICLSALLSAAVVPLLAWWSPQWSYFIAISAGTAAGPSLNRMPSASRIWPGIVAALWGAGAIISAVRALGGWLILHRTRRNSVHFMSDQAAEVRIGNVSTPIACGVIKPLIILPESATQWEPIRLRAVLLHESAHVRRRDCLAKLVARVSRTVLWWNPLAHILAARADQEQEWACDEAVLSAGVAPDDYARALLATARECSNPLLLGCAMSSSATLRARLENLFACRAEATTISRRTVIAIPLLLALMTGVSFAEKIYKIGPGVTPPTILYKAEPQYTDEARAAKIEGTVTLSIIVGVDQAAHDIRIVQSLDPGLDTNAIKAIMTWRFQPGIKDGQPVPVQAMIQVNYRLQ
ncbi:MAG TPA: M56 family metallopeptidase [Bryobacteraceae bacterium]|nr:M56 family metallopeptidase [Bryobacteraceae bacterium]